MKGDLVCLNGSVLPASEARISPFDAGFQFGDGAFETICAVDGKALYVGDHARRLRRALEMLEITGAPDDGAIIRWITDLLQAMDAMRGKMRVKVIVTRGVPGDGGRPTTFVYAAPYEAPAPGAVVALYLPEASRRHPFSGYKTLNYLYHLRLRDEARRSGFHDAFLTDAAGNPVETTASAILIRTVDGWIHPPVEGRLDSISLPRVVRLLEKEGERIFSSTISMEMLLSAETVWTSNALTGPLPVSRINDHRCADPRAAEALRLRTVYLGGGA